MPLMNSSFFWSGEGLKKKGENKYGIDEIDPVYVTIFLTLVLFLWDVGELSSLKYVYTSLINILDEPRDSKGIKDVVWSL